MTDGCHEANRGRRERVGIGNVNVKEPATACDVLILYVRVEGMRGPRLALRVYY
jgi:hypothetical protein